MAKNRNDEPRKVLTGYLRPMCVRCQVQMDTYFTGVSVILIVRAHPQEPHALYSADEYRCPRCGTSIIAGYSVPSYNKTEIDRALSGGGYIRIFEDTRLADQELGRVYQNKVHDKS